MTPFPGYPVKLTDQPCPPRPSPRPHTLLHTLDYVFLRPTLIHAPSSTAPHRLSHPTVCLALLPSTPPKPPRLACSLTCPWCSPSCSCTRNRGAGHGSSVFHCSRGARLHTRPQGGRTGRPRRPQVVHMSALARGYRASLWRPLNHSPSHPGPCSPFR